MANLFSDIIYKHSSFKAFTEAYNYLHATNFGQRFLLNAKRLADAFFVMELIKFYDEHSISKHLESKFDTFSTLLTFLP